MRIVLIGPPGSGKGTQAQLLSQTLRVPHISTGETAQPGFLLDGFPRTLEQAIALDEILDEQHHELAAVLDFEIAEDEVVARRLARAGAHPVGRSTDRGRIRRR